MFDLRPGPGCCVTLWWSNSVSTRSVQGSPQGKTLQSKHRTLALPLHHTSHTTIILPFFHGSPQRWEAGKLSSEWKNCIPQKGKERRKTLLQTCCFILVQNFFIFPFFFFFFKMRERESNLVWQIKAQLIFKSACSQLSHPVALSLGNIIEAHTIYTKAISFLQACQGDALGEPKIWQKKIYVQLLHIISHYDSPQSFNFKNKWPL